MYGKLQRENHDSITYKLLCALECKSKHDQREENQI